MAKPVTNYEVNIRIKGEDSPPTATVLARLLRSKLIESGYDVTVRVKVRSDEPVSENV